MESRSTKLPVPQGSHAVALCAELTGQLRRSMHWERHPPASEQPQNAATEMLTRHSGITICDLLPDAGCEIRLVTGWGRRTMELGLHRTGRPCCTMPAASPAAIVDSKQMTPCGQQPAELREHNQGQDRQRQPPAATLHITLKGLGTRLVVWKVEPPDACWTRMPQDSDRLSASAAEQPSR